MATATKKCKVCGNEYEYCRTNRRTGTFRWQDVACCHEHGAIYLAKIRESRGIKQENKPDEAIAETVKHTFIAYDIDDPDEDDTWVEEYLDDEDDE